MPASKNRISYKCENCSKEFIQFNCRNIFCCSSCKLEFRKPEKRISNNIYMGKNRLKKKEYDKKYYIENSEKIKLRSKHWRNENKTQRWAKEKELLNNNPQKYLYKRIQTLLGTYLRKRKIPKYSKTFCMLNFTLEELEFKLKSTIPKGSTWEDFLKGKLHIDHIKPHSLFEYSSPNDDEFKECWSLDNLQLLTREDNIKKQNKYEN